MKRTRAIMLWFTRLSRKIHDNMLEILWSTTFEWICGDTQFSPLIKETADRAVILFFRHYRATAGNATAWRHQPRQRRTRCDGSGACHSRSSTWRHCISSCRRRRQLRRVTWRHCVIAGDGDWDEKHWHVCCWTIIILKSIVLPILHFLWSGQISK